MRRTFERGSKARLSFSGGLCLNRTNGKDSRVRLGTNFRLYPPRATRSCKHNGQCVECRQVDFFWCGSPEELQGFAKAWCTKYSAVQCSKHAISFFPATFASILSAMFTGACGPPEKLSLAYMPCSYILRMIVKFAYCLVRNSRPDVHEIFSLLHKMASTQ